MSELHGNRAFAHARCDPFHRTVADVTRREDAGHTGFRPIRVTGQRPSLGPLSVAHQVRSGKDKTALVALHHARQPIRVGLCANEDREQVRGYRFSFAAVCAVNGKGFEVGFSEDFHHLGSAFPPGYSAFS